jgi:hypothetical protein
MLCPPAVSEMGVSIGRASVNVQGYFPNTASPAASGCQINGRFVTAVIVTGLRAYATAPERS